MTGVDGVGGAGAGGPADGRGPPAPPPPSSPSPVDLVRWSETLSGIARTGLGFTDSLYERERYEEVLRVAADIAVCAGHAVPGAAAPKDMEAEAAAADAVIAGWHGLIAPGIEGYVTPKIAVGAVVGNERQEILLVQRADSGVWLYPTGWADVGYSASEVAVKEVFEETGIRCEPSRLIALLDGLRLGFTRVALYTAIFECRAVGGSLAVHPLECLDVGWFAHDHLPDPLAGNGHLWVDQAFRAIRDDSIDVLFDRPRYPPWEIPAAEL